MITPEVVFSELFTTQRLNYFSKHYHIWKLKLDFILANKGIDYVLHQPQPSDHRPSQRYQWVLDDTRCQMLILKAIESKGSFQWPGPHRTAKSMIDYLDSIFRVDRASFSIQLSLFYPYINLRMVHGASMSKHVLEMRAAACQLENAGVKVPDEMQAVILMNNLPESWTDVAYLLNLQLGKKDELSFDSVSRKLRVAAEMRPRQLSVSSHPGSMMYCCRCRQWDHNPSLCPEVREINSNFVKNNSGNNFPFVEEDLDVWESRYHELKTSERLNNTGANYLSWKSTILTVFNGLGLRYVLEQRKPSEPTDSTPEQEANDYDKWIADDSTCRHLILGAMEDNLLVTFKSQPTATALLFELDDWFEFPSLDRRMTLFRQYVECVMSDDTEINDHIRNMKAMVKELRRAGIDVPEEIEALILFDSLPSYWNDIRIKVILLIDEETKAGMNVLESVIKNVRNVGHKIHPPKESPNLNDSNNYKRKFKKRKRYNRRY